MKENGGNGARFDMRRPCTNCPFRNDDTAIRFSSSLRALEIAMTAMLHGFPCHTTAEYIEEENEPNGNSGYVFGTDTQHCAGYLIMKVREGETCPWPGIGNDADTLEYIRQNVDSESPVFDNLGEFIEANARKMPDDA